MIKTTIPLILNPAIQEIGTACLRLDDVEEAARKRPVPGVLETPFLNMFYYVICLDNTMSP